MRRSGTAVLPLHGGRVPFWLSTRMAKLSGAIVEAILIEYGKEELLSRLSDPLWFQSLGCVLGMDWHSSGITTSVMGALKKSVNPRFREWGIYVCGGRGKFSRQTPNELMVVADQIGLDGDELVRCSKLSAKVDNTAVQDGFQLYLHSFVVSDSGDWAVIQQGMDVSQKLARRYHWHSPHIRSFTEEPHSFIYGLNRGPILNLVDKKARDTRNRILEIARENPNRMIPEIKKLVMPSHHDVRAKDVNLKRLGSILALCQNRELLDFESLLLLKGLGPRTLQSLTLVSEVIYGTPSRFKDPARFSFAHGGKDGHPFPVPLYTYDETIKVLRTALKRARIGVYDKQRAIQKLHQIATNLEHNFTPNQRFHDVVAKERRQSHLYGGMTVNGPALPPTTKQLVLF